MGGKGGGIKLGIDMSLDLEKFSERNYSYFYLLILRNEISFQNLLLFSIFKILEILRKYFSVSSVRRSLGLAPQLLLNNQTFHKSQSDPGHKYKDKDDDNDNDNDKYIYRTLSKSNL